jgi:hypothetical protein
MQSGKTFGTTAPLSTHKSSSTLIVVQHGGSALQGRVCCKTTAVELKLEIEMHQFAFERQASNDIQVPSPTLISIAGATITPLIFDTARNLDFSGGYSGPVFSWPTG